MDDIPIWKNADDAFRRRIVRFGVLQVVENNLISELETVEESLKELERTFGERKQRLMGRHESIKKMCDEVSQQIIDEDPDERWNTQYDYCTELALPSETYVDCESWTESDSVAASSSFSNS